MILCKTNVPEFGAGANSRNPVWGATGNPFNPELNPGGSSGGSAVALATDMLPVCTGSDTGGSLRIPASACGLVGLKATRGRIPLGPDQGEGWGGYVQWGVLTRSVRDTAGILHAISGPMPGDPYGVAPPTRPFVQEVGADPGKLRIGFSTRSVFGKETDPACVAATKETAQLLESLGHHVEEAWPTFDRDRLVQAYLTQVGIGTAAEIDDMAKWTGRKPSPAFFEASTWFLNQVGRTLSGVELQHARDAIQEAGRQMAAFHERYDLFLGPTLAHPPIKLGQLALKPAERVGLGALRTLPVGAAVRAVLAQLAANNFERTPNTQIFNQTGQPAISLPMYQAPGGLPIGIQLAARMGEEATLLRVAAQLEAARPWIGRVPGVVA